MMPEFSEFFILLVIRIYDGFELSITNLHSTIKEMIKSYDHFLNKAKILRLYCKVSSVIRNI